MKLRLLFCLFTLSVSLTAQIKNKTPNLSTYQNDEREDLRFNGTLSEVLDSAFNRIAKVSNIKGFSASIALPNGEVWKKASGTASTVPNVTTLTTDHLIGMGSVTKSFAATTLLKLIDEGKASLNDSLGKFLPKYKNIEGKITLKQILNHTSGINDYLNENEDFSNLINESPDSIWSVDTILTYFVKSKNFNPGTSWSYSNTNYLLAGKVIEAIEQSPWHVVVRKKILEPLGLNHTYAYPNENIGNELFSNAFLDVDGSGNSVDLNTLNYPLEGLFSAASSAGNLITTPEDLNKFMVGVLSGSFFSTSLYNEIYKNYAPSAAGLRYGLGFMSLSITNNLKNYGHNGYIIHQAISNYLPTEKIAISVMQNDGTEFDPNVGAKSYDLYIMYLELLDAYLKFDVTSSKDIETKNTFRLKANIVSTTLELAENFQSVEKFIIVNQDGRIMQNIASDQKKIDISSLPNGLYFIKNQGTAYGFMKVD